ncbi:MAG: c-type cytochrome [Pikeienuella sp.]
MRRLSILALIAVIIGFGAFMTLTIPGGEPPERVERLVGDVDRGEVIFHAGGCASCHTAPGSDDKLVLTGGQAFASPFGTFYAPNISPHADGIAGWSALDLVNAMKHGVSPEGSHYFPAFPYASYARAEIADIVDLKAYLDTLPAVASTEKPHDIGFPFNIRRTLGLWKLMFVTDAPVLAEVPTEQIKRGRYLAEALGHCGECHTPRNALGGLKMASWLGGAPTPDGKGKVPNITPAVLDWIEGDIVEYLTSGFTPEYDVVGGHMAKVVANTAKLPLADREAIAAYLKAVAPIAK